MNAPKTPNLVAAVERIAARYNELPSTSRPNVQGPEWQAKERAIDNAYAARNVDAYKEAVAAYERFALEQFKGAGK